MTDMAIISAGFKHAPFIERAKAMNVHIRNRNFGYPFRIWIDDYPEGYDVETMSPYLIKYYCMEEMIKEGYTKILWMDSSMRFWKGPDHILNLVNNDGYFLVGDDARLGTAIAGTLNVWSTDKFLKTLNLTREDAKEIPMILGGVFALNIESDAGKRIYKLYKRIAIDHPEIWNGPRGIPWTTTAYDPRGKKELSLDKRVQGHRHDTSVMSYVCYKENIKPTQKDPLGPWYYHNTFLEVRANPIDERLRIRQDPLYNPLAGTGKFPPNAVIVSSASYHGDRPWDYEREDPKSDKHFDFFGDPHKKRNSP